MGSGRTHLSPALLTGSYQLGWFVITRAGKEVRIITKAEAGRREEEVRLSITYRFIDDEHQSRDQNASSRALWAT